MPLSFDNAPQKEADQLGTSHHEENTISSSTAKTPPQWGQGVLLEWKKLSFYASPSGTRLYRRLLDFFQGWRTGKGGKGGKVLLDDVNGRVLPGEIVALMGPSGAC